MKPGGGQMIQSALKTLLMLVFCHVLLIGGAAAAVRIDSLPEPPPSAKLRVFTVVMTTETSSVKRPVLWLVSPEELRVSMTGEINKMLQAQGIYEVTSAREIYAVLGNQTISAWEWSAKNMALLKNVGKALHADYALLFERGYSVHLQFDARMVNLNTGREFSASNYISTPALMQMTNNQKKQAGSEAIKIIYRQLFSDAKGDMLNTAISKGKAVMEKPQDPVPGTGASADLPKEPIAVQKEVSEKPVQSQTIPKREPSAMQRPLPQTPTGEVSTQKDISENPLQPLPKAEQETAPEAVQTKNRQAAFEKELDTALFAKDKTSKYRRLVVYDVDAAEHMKVVGLILTEALREELHNVGGFILVNRENILKIMDEYKLQKSGVVDEAQAVRMGKWLAASEVITGNLATLGATSILQVKRTDILTLGTITMGSVKCPSGREDELLDQMPQLARRLAQKGK
jgi:hypothetical protein